MGPSLSVPELLIGMIEAYGAPRPSSFGYGELLEDLVQAISQFGTGGGPSVKSVLSYGADPTGQRESTEAFNRALEALPTINTWHNSGMANNWTQTEVPYGRITGGGQFLLNQDTQLNGFGPWVEFDGLGWTNLIDYNAAPGTALINLLNPYSAGNTSNSKYGGVGPLGQGPAGGLLWWSGGVRNTRIDGTQAQPGCGGIYGGGGEYCHVDNVLIGNYGHDGSGGGYGINFECITGMTGDTETYNINFQSYNNDNAFMFNGNPSAAPLSIVSQSQGRLWCRMEAFPGQNGIVLNNQAWVYHSQIYLTGVMYQGTEPASAIHGCSLVLDGATTKMQHTHIDIRLEMDQIGTDTWLPRTLHLDNINGSLIDQCDGLLGWITFGTGDWANAQPGIGTINDFFQFYGPTFGDTTLSMSGNYTVLAGNAVGS